MLSFPTIINFPQPFNGALRVLGLVLILSFSSASFAITPAECDQTPDAYSSVPLPCAVQLPNEESDFPFLAWYGDLASTGYVEKEIQFWGTGYEYEYADEENQSPLVAPIDKGSEDAADNYVTRAIIRHPESPADFNGVVYVEFLNATAGYDGSPHWDLTHRSIMADGAAYVGLTYSDQTAEFMRGWNAARYADLDIPTRAYTWDMMNQLVALLRAASEPSNPLQNFPVNAVIAMGYSQSARYTLTMSNSFYPSYSAAAPCTEALQALAQCVPVIDGFLVAAGGSAGSKLDGAKSHSLGDRRNCGNALNRETSCMEGVVEPLDDDPYEHDLPKYVNFTTESDIESARVRQTMADQPYARFYEVAGTSHVDFWGSINGQKVAEKQFGTPATGVINSPCVLPFNPLRTGIPLSAIQHRLARWIQYDEMPPPNYFMIWEGVWVRDPVTFNYQVNWVRDDGDNDADDGDDGRGDGNVIGGVRPPRIGVPLGRYYGSNFYDGPVFSVERIFCEGIYGGFDAYTPEELQARYASNRQFVVWTWWNMWLSYLDGFLLAVDAPIIMNEAKSLDIVPDE